MKLTMTTFLPYLQPAAFFNQRDKVFYFHASKVSHFPFKGLTNETCTPTYFHQGRCIAQQQAAGRTAVYRQINSRNPALIGRVRVAELRGTPL